MRKYRIKYDPQQDWSPWLIQTSFFGLIWETTNSCSSYQKAKYVVERLMTKAETYYPPFPNYIEK